MDRRQLPEDFKEFIIFLNKNEVQYLLVGGWAVGLYGTPRATKDIVFLIAVDDDNLSKLENALNDFDAPYVDVAHFKEKCNCFRMGRSPVQIDIINEADGIDFDDSYKRRNIITIQNVPISVVSKEDLIKNKKASGRYRDLADAENLENF
jgi:hypothetical protein